MKRITLTICAAMVLLYACNNAAKNETTTDTSTVSTSDTATKDKAWVPVDTSKMWQAMMDYAKVGEPQKMLAKSNGTWDAVVIMRMMENSPADTSKGTSTNKMIMGDRYQVSTFKGNMMGAPFEGIATTGYDNAKKVFISTWIDNMGSGIMTMEGPWDEASKTITMTGTMVSPLDGRTCNIKQVYKMVDDNTQVMEMYGPDPLTGNQYKSIEIKYTRRK